MYVTKVREMAIYRVSHHVILQSYKYLKSLLHTVATENFPTILQNPPHLLHRDFTYPFCYKMLHLFFNFRSVFRSGPDRLLSFIQTFFNQG